MTLAAPKKTIQIVPSLLAADLSRLGDELRAAASAGIDWVSVDVMDGHFVPNLSFGPEHVRLIKKREKMFVDAHLMVTNPEKIVPYFLEAGADLITVHLEACRDARKLLRDIRKQGVAAGLAIKPETPVSSLLELIDEMDLALIMTVEPGFGGAKFLEAMLPKIKAVRQVIDERGLNCWLQVDGGINLSTISMAAAAGADSLVAGTAIFGSGNIASAVKSLRERAQISFDLKK